MYIDVDGDDIEGDVLRLHMLESGTDSEYDGVIFGRIDTQKVELEDEDGAPETENELQTKDHATDEILLPVESGIDFSESDEMSKIWEAKFNELDAQVQANKVNVQANGEQIDVVDEKVDVVEEQVELIEEEDTSNTLSAWYFKNPDTDAWMLYDNDQNPSEWSDGFIEADLEPMYDSPNVPQIALLSVLCTAMFLYIGCAILCTRSALMTGTTSLYQLWCPKCFHGVDGLGCKACKCCHRKDCYEPQELESKA